MRSLALVVLLAGPAALALAEDSLHGVVSFSGEGASFPRGFAPLTGPRVSIGCFTSAPGPEVEAAALRAGLCCVPWPGPHVVLDVVFKPGTTKADRKAVEACHVGYYGLTAGGAPPHSRARPWRR